MTDTDGTKLLEKALLGKDEQIRKLSAELSSNKVQISEYRQIVQELSEKVKNYEKLYGTVFRK